MLTASRGLEEAIEASARSAPAAVAEPVTALAARLTARTGTEAALRAFAADIDDPAGDRIAAALIIATGRRGGAVRDVLNALAVMLARDVAARREIEAERAQHRTTLRWIAVFVGGFTVFAVLNRAYSSPYGTVAGEVVLAIVAGLYAAGLAWLHRLGSMPGPRPVPEPGRRGAVAARREPVATGNGPAVNLWALAARRPLRPRRLPGRARDRARARPGSMPRWPGWTGAAQDWAARPRPGRPGPGAGAAHRRGAALAARAGGRPGPARAGPGELARQQGRLRPARPGVPCAAGRPGHAGAGTACPGPSPCSRRWPSGPRCSSRLTWSPGSTPPSGGPTSGTP